MMAYTKAQDILPRHLLAAVQDYIDGQTLYIPRKAANRKAWGETRNSKQRLRARNVEIYRRYKAGTAVRDLAAVYYLSVKAVYKIIAAQKAA